MNNIYFDTPDLKFYYDTKFRKLTRYKLRARYYGLQATDVVWAEIKYRNSSLTWKQRCCLPIERWHEIFAPNLDDCRHPNIKDRLDGFEDFIYWCNAQPRLHVRYVREPYVTELEDYGRITFDRQLCCRSVRDSLELAYDEPVLRYFDDPVNSRSDESPVILELKVETMIPFWAIELIHKFRLTQRAFSKYCYGIDSVSGYFDNGRISIFDYET